MKTQLLLQHKLFFFHFFLYACKTAEVKTVFHGAEKRTVTFLLQPNGMNAFELEPAKKAIIACFLNNEKNYLSKYVFVDYDLIRNV